MSNTHQIIVLILISTTTLHAQTHDATPSSEIPRKRFTCPVEPNCSCEEFTSKVDFYCPKFNPTLYVNIEDNRRTDMRCSPDSDQDAYDFRSVQNLEIGNAPLLLVADCQLDKDQPILESFKFLGVTNVRNFLYKNTKEGVRYNARYFEGLEQLENLTLAEGVISLEKDTFSGFRDLKRLTIEHNKLVLRPGTFEVLTNLTNLQVAYNHISKLEPGVFDGLVNLEALSLAFNSIAKIESSTFEGLRLLRMLNLRVNKIESFDSNAFATLTELTRLEVTFNPFVSLPTKMFATNKKLKTLILTNNKNFTTLAEDLLADLPALDVVNLNSNGIQHLSKLLFRGSSNITELNLAHNRLESLPEELLSDQQRLQILNLNHNRLKEIPDYFFERTNELRTLHLSNNHLRSLSEKVFSKLGRLKELHLENNKLQTIAQFIFSGTPILEEIYMQNNQLDFHANSFKHEELSIADNDNTPFQVLSNLRILQLRNNSISTIFQDWYINNLELTNLDLSFNNISELSYTDLQFQSNISLNLANNEISRIILADLDLKSNQKINVNLNNNPLQCDCNLLKFVQLVQSRPEHGLLFTTDNLRCAEPRNLFDASMDELQTKDLVCEFPSAEDCPQNCDCALRLVDHTAVINCSGRGLTHIPKLPTPSHLHEDFNALELHVENNEITFLPDSYLTGYNEVTQLYAQNNSIRKVLPQNIPSKLQFLDLSQNQLQLVEDPTLEVLNRSSHLQTVKLSQNHWQCDCLASNFLIFVQQNPHLIADISRVQCHPSGKSFDSITVNELCYEDYTIQLVMCFVIAALGLLIGLTSLLFFRYQTEVKVWLFTHNLFLSLITEEELDRDKLYDAFISYSHLDEEFITDELIPKLENEPMNFKTCWHVRDFMPGEMIMTQIVKSIEASRRTVIVLSKNFLESSWAKQEFRQAHVQSMEDNRVRVIVVIYEDIGNIDQLDGELKAYLKTNTYVKWGDPWFWQKLRYAMPHPLKVKGIKSAVSEIHLQQVTATKPTPV
ncbi:protein toll-like [Armigeres subalbatus]|uniref:protein toll-like n=1 Tax=Armigeres subalbatus TaxID=124917 RepID=UPI002ED15C9F